MKIREGFKMLKRAAAAPAQVDLLKLASIEPLTDVQTQQLFYLAITMLDGTATPEHTAEMVDRVKPGVRAQLRAAGGFAAIEEIGKIGYAERRAAIAAQFEEMLAHTSNPEEEGDAHGTH